MAKVEAPVQATDRADKRRQPIQGPQIKNVNVAHLVAKPAGSAAPSSRK
jgi:hypothetical protein